MYCNQCRQLQYKSITIYAVQWAIDIPQPFFSNTSRKIPHSEVWGVDRECKVWLKLYDCNCWAVRTVELYIAAICRECIVAWDDIWLAMTWQMLTNIIIQHHCSSIHKILGGSQSTQTYKFRIIRQAWKIWGFNSLRPSNAYIFVGFNLVAQALGNAYKPTKEPINYRGPGGDWTLDLQTEATSSAASCPTRSLHATGIVSNNTIQRHARGCPGKLTTRLECTGVNIHFCWFDFDALAQGHGYKHHLFR